MGQGRTVPGRRDLRPRGERPPDARDRVLNDVAALDFESDLRDVRETVKARLADIAVEGGALVVKGGAPRRANPSAAGAALGQGGQRILAGIDTIRTLGTVQIPADAFLIVEGETPREHLSDVVIATVLVGFAGVNLAGLAQGRRRRRGIPTPSPPEKK